MGKVLWRVARARRFWAAMFGSMPIIPESTKTLRPGFISRRFWSVVNWAEVAEELRRVEVRRSFYRMAQWQICRLALFYFSNSIVRRCGAIFWFGTGGACFGKHAVLLNGAGAFGFLAAKFSRACCANSARSRSRFCNSAREWALAEPVRGSWIANAYNPAQ